ncbi:MAG: YihY/virulence factor BrkB family protein [Ruminococcaceae bacterium]|nr:YihY/virulence factor BrkB family protein [Oscillospiraceae bacterium]
MKQNNRKILTDGGVWKTARQLLRRYQRHGVGRSSAALTYYLVFAAFPLLVFFSALLGALEVDEESVLRLFASLLPQDVERVVRSYLSYVTVHYSRRLLWFSLIFSVWFPMRATDCLLAAMRRAFGTVEMRRTLRHRVHTVLFTVWLVVTWSAAMVLMTVGRRALEVLAGVLHLPAGFADLWNYLRFFLLGLVMFAALAVLYMLALGKRQPLRKVAAGVMASLVAWMVLSAAFSYYVEHVAQYTQLYGSIATVVVTLLWLYMSSAVLIMGAELNAVLRRKYRTAV